MSIHISHYHYCQFVIPPTLSKQGYELQYVGTIPIKVGTILSCIRWAPPIIHFLSEITYFVEIDVVMSRIRSFE